MMLQQDEAGNDPSKTQREIQWERQLLVRIEADSSPALLLAGLATLAALVAWLWRPPPALQAHLPNGRPPAWRKKSPCPMCMAIYLVCDNQGLCVFLAAQPTGGSLGPGQRPETQLQRELHLLRVRWEGDEFRFECAQEGKPSEVFWLRRQAPGLPGRPSRVGRVCLTDCRKSVFMI